MSKILRQIDLQNVEIEDKFWSGRLETNINVTIPFEYKQCKRTGRLDALKLDWKEGGKNKPHIYWDSDTAKWIEAAAYSLVVKKDCSLERKVDGVIDLIASAQQSDGYLNSYFTTVAPQKRFKNLRDGHELYCAGHLIEAAVAYYNATGKDKFLNVMCRYADYLTEVFGSGRGQMKGYPGHQVIEMALVKLYKVTANGKYLQLAKFFVDQRGNSPVWFEQERLGGNFERFNSDKHYVEDFSYNQAHKPVRQQDKADGHAVRACYMYSGMADVAAETNDRDLIRVCRKIWDSITIARMYVTGGVGSAYYSERFSFDGDLPNETAYSETCASIALIFFAQRMFNIDKDSRYIDVLEKALYNTVCGSVSFDGMHFFYANPLEEYPPAREYRGKYENENHVQSVRQEWYDTACCPPNIARLLASLGNYVYAHSGKDIYVNLYIGSKADFEIGSTHISLHQKTNYPYEGKVVFNAKVSEPVKSTIAFRLPEWCPRATMKINAKSVNIKECTTKGYIRVSRLWQNNDKVELVFDMPVRKVYANSIVRQDAGRFAIQRGPLIYCIESVDNGKFLSNIAVDKNTKFTVANKRILGQAISVINFSGKRRIDSGKKLYVYDSIKEKKVCLRAIPFYLRANRGLAEMMVWLREC